MMRVSTNSKDSKSELGKRSKNVKIQQWWEFEQKIPNQGWAKEAARQSLKKERAEVDILGRRQKDEKCVLFEEPPCRAALFTGKEINRTISSCLSMHTLGRSQKWTMREIQMWKEGPKHRIFLQRKNSLAQDRRGGGTIQRHQASKLANASKPLNWARNTGY